MRSWMGRHSRLTRSRRPTAAPRYTRRVAWTRGPHHGRQPRRVRLPGRRVEHDAAQRVGCGLAGRVWTRRRWTSTSIRTKGSTTHPRTSVHADLVLNRSHRAHEILLLEATASSGGRLLFLVRGKKQFNLIDGTQGSTPPEFVFAFDEAGSARTRATGLAFNEHWFYSENAFIGCGPNPGVVRPDQACLPAIRRILGPKALPPCAS